MEKHRRRFGFTLVELVVTIVVVAVVAAVGVAVMSSLRSRSAVEAARVEAQQVQREMRALLVFGESPDDALAVVSESFPDEVELTFVDADGSGSLDLGEVVSVSRVGGYVGSFVLSGSEWSSVSVSEPVFSPLDLGPVLWLDASDTASITEVGGRVSQWDDLSGNGNHMVQQTAEDQPRTGSQTINGLNVLDTLDVGRAMHTQSSVDTEQTFTVFAVVEKGSSHFGTVFGSLHPTEFADYVTLEGYLASPNPPGYRINAGSQVPSSAQLPTMPSLPEGQLLLAGRFDNESSSMRINGTTVATGTVGTSGLQLVSVFSSWYDPADADFNNYSGKIAEVIVVAGAMTAEEIAATETYLADKWGVVLP